MQYLKKSISVLQQQRNNLLPLPLHFSAITYQLSAKIRMLPMSKISIGKF